MFTSELFSTHAWTNSELLPKNFQEHSDYKCHLHPLNLEHNHAHFGFQISGTHSVDFPGIHLEADEKLEDLHHRPIAFVDHVLLKAGSLSHHSCQAF